MIHVSDLVREIGHLALETALRVQRGDRHRMLPRATMLEYPLACFRSQVKAAKPGVAVFQPVDDSQALSVMVKAPIIGKQKRQNALSRMTKRRVAKVMRKRNRLGEILV